MMNKTKTQHRTLSMLDKKFTLREFNLFFIIIFQKLGFEFYQMVSLRDDLHAISNSIF